MKLVERKFLLPFVVVTSLFALWGFANDITNPMVAAFQTLMELPAAKASLMGTGDRYLSQALFPASYIKMPLFQQKRGQAV